VFDYRDKLVAVICVVGRAGAMNGNWDGPVVKSLIAAAGDLSRQLGHVDDKRRPEPPLTSRSKAGKPAASALGADAAGQTAAASQSQQKSGKLLEQVGLAP
jgi:hypothetical protein